jgi:hypothetical protein
VLKQVFRRTNHLLHFLSGDGTWRMTALETKCVDAAMSHLPEAVRDLVRAQLRQPFFVERIPAGRINVFRFYSPDPGLRIPDPAFLDSLVNVRLVVDGKPQVAHVTFYKGYVFSVELKKPAKYYVGKTVIVVEVTTGRSGESSYTRALDRAEHGRDEDS